MKKVLYVDNSRESCKLIMLNLNMYVGVDPISLANHEQALQLLKKANFDLVITMASVDGKKTALEIHKYIQAVENGTPMIVIGEEKLLDKYHDLIRIENIPDKIIKTAAKALGVTAKEMSEKEVPAYYPVPISYFYQIDQTNCDIYIKSGKEDSSKYVKRLHAGDNFDEEDLKKYEDKGVSHFYVPANLRLEFVNFFSDQIVERMNEANQGILEKIKSTNIAFEHFSTQLKELGLNERTIKGANQCMSSIAETAHGGGSRLKELLENLYSDEISYRFKHVQLISTLAYHAIGNMNWGNDQQKKVLVFVAFFHDIMLEDDKQAKITNEELLEYATYDNKTKKLIREHALLATQLVRDYPHSPMGVDSIIRQHHGSKTGVGFELNYPLDISPLSMVFIVCEALAEEILKRESSDFSLESILNELLATFQKRKYQEILKTFFKF